MRGIGRGGPWKSRCFWALKWHERSQCHLGPKKSIKTTGTLVVLCTRVLLCSVVVCKRGLRSPWPGFKSRPTQFCVTGSEDRVLWWVWVPVWVSSVGGIVVSIAAFKAGNPGSIPGRRSFVLQVLKTESYEFESHSVSEVRWYSGEHSCLQSR